MFVSFCIASCFASFIKEDEFKIFFDPAQLLMRDWFLNDPVTHLMMQLGTEDRQVAVRHIIAFNQPELNLLFSRMYQSINIFDFLTLSSSRHPPKTMVERFTAPLTDFLTSFVRNRPGRCLYDFVPLELRDPLKYDEMFREVVDVSAREGDVDGVDFYVSRESLGCELCDWKSYVIGASVSSNSGILRIDFGETTRFIDVSNSCGADLSRKYKNIVMVPRQRFLLVETREGADARLWHADSS